MAPIKAQIWALDARLPLDGIRTFDQSVREVTARPRFQVVLLTVFAAVGLLLAVIGVYGVVSYSVGLRTREIGVRMALGATTGAVRRLVVAQGTKVVLVGVVVGVAVALASTRFLRAMLYDVKPVDPVVFVAMSITMVAVGMLASYMPARRASRVDPTEALRSE